MVAINGATNREGEAVHPVVERARDTEKLVQVDVDADHLREELPLTRSGDQ